MRWLLYLAAYLIAVAAFLAWWRSVRRRAAARETPPPAPERAAHSLDALSGEIIAFDRVLSDDEARWIDTGIYIAASIRAHRGEAFRA